MQHTMADYRQAPEAIEEEAGRYRVSRVAFYFHRLSRPGGAERMICQVANELAKRGVVVHMISWDREQESSFYPLHHAVRTHRLGLFPGVLDKFRRTRRLSALLSCNQVEVLIGFVMSGDKTVFAAAKMAGVKLVVAERNAPSMYWLRYSWMQRWTSFLLLHLADRIAVQFPAYVAGYPSNLRKRIVVIPNPVPIAQQRARPAEANESGRFTLLAVSRLDRVQKRIDCLIRAFQLVAPQHPDWDLLIIGDGPDETALHALVKECGMSDRVRIEPARAEVFSFYVQAHLFAIPSLWEGFPNALAEALCHGVPAVGFADAAGVADLIGDDAGWLASGLDDEVSLARTLTLAMVDDQERTRRGDQALRKMSAFAPQDQFERWAKLLNDVRGESVR